MVRNLHLFILLCGALITLQGCINPQNIEEPEPEKGQFKIVLTSGPSQTKGFWEVDPEKRNSGELCEQELHSVTILIYDQYGIVSPHHLSAAELVRKSSVFSLSKAVTGNRLSFRAIANFKVRENLIENNLHNENPGDICDYYNLIKPAGSASTTTLKHYVFLNLSQRTSSTSCGAPQYQSGQGLCND